MSKIYTILAKNNLADCQVEILAELSQKGLESYKEKALKRLQEVAEIPGFRKGKVPEAKLREKFGELGLLEEAAQLAIEDSAIEAIAETKVNFIGRPDIAITKISEGAPVEFKIVLSVLPDIKLPNYKTIAKSVAQEKADAVTEKQIDETVEEIRRLYAQEHHSHAPGEVHRDDEELKLPEVNDAFVKTFGNFENVPAFRAKLAENIAKEKEMRVRDTRRLKILEGIAAEAAFTLPSLIIENELDKMQAQFAGDIANMGLQPEEYLKHIKKTWDALRKEWRADAEKRAKTQLLLQKIALEERIEPTKEEVEKQVAFLLEQYKQADESRARAYVEQIITNEAVLKFLEEQK